MLKAHYSMQFNKELEHSFYCIRLKAHSGNERPQNRCSQSFIAVNDQSCFIKSLLFAYSNYLRNTVKLTTVGALFNTNPFAPSLDLNGLNYSASTTQKKKRKNESRKFASSIHLDKTNLVQKVSKSLTNLLQP